MLKTINTCVTGLQSRRRQPYRGNQPASGRAACPWLCFVDWVAHCGMSHGPVQANSHPWRCVSGWVPHAPSAATEPAPDVSHGDPTSRRESARCPPPAIPAILSTRQCVIIQARICHFPIPSKSASWILCSLRTLSQGVPASLLSRSMYRGLNAVHCRVWQVSPKQVLFQRCRLRLPTAGYRHRVAQLKMR
jgi:hypothetical protein